MHVWLSENTDFRVEVLNVTVLKRTDIANQFQVAEPEKQEDGSTIIPITFDFLDQGDGALVQVIHNGDARTNVHVEGRLKGSHDPLQQGAPRLTPRFAMIMIYALDSKFFAAVSSLFLIMCGIFLIFQGTNKSTDRFFMILGMFYILISLLFMWVKFFLSVRKVPVTIDPVDNDFHNKKN